MNKVYKASRLVRRVFQEAYCSDARGHSNLKVRTAVEKHVMYRHEFNE